MTHEAKTPPEAIVAAAAPPAEDVDPCFERRPTWRERLRSGRWLGLPASDWAGIGGLLVLTVGAIWMMLDLLRQVQPQTRTIGYWILALQSAIFGAIIAYNILRRQLADLRLHTAGLLTLSRRSLDDERTIIENMRALLEEAYTAGHQEGHAAWVALADAAQTRNEELARALAEHRLPLPATAAELRAMADEVASLRRSLTQLEAKYPELTAGIADINSQADALAAELARQGQRQHSTLDSIDQRILTLLSAAPSLTDEAIGHDPAVFLERSQVTRRRSKLAAMGYTVAQKRQGQRPSPR
jgi:hypothetical protein